MIYRGYDILKNREGSYGLHSNGSYPVVTETFPTDEAAMNWIDKYHREQRAAKQSYTLFPRPVPAGRGLRA